MELFSKKQELWDTLDIHRQKGLSIGFVPTMGALHKGHLSLVERAARENDIVVVSIFVNPTQFNDPKDLEKYPRDLEKDMKLLSPCSCDYIFNPDVYELYPEPDTRVFNFGNIEKVMEGEFRSGHFNGVAQVVSKLFEAVNPNRAYFGLKDFQQLVIINNLVKQLNLDLEIVPCDIVREADGVAMSSRNMLLTDEYRNAAPLIFKTLCEAKKQGDKMSVEEVSRWVVDNINSNSLLKVEYFNIVDDVDLMPVNSWSDPVRKVGCIAVFAGAVRLIDNIIF
jgi:pantoate--beta-alanine ligase